MNLLIRSFSSKIRKNTYELRVWSKSLLILAVTFSITISSFSYAEANPTVSKSLTISELQEISSPLPEVKNGNLSEADPTTLDNILADGKLTIAFFGSCIALASLVWGQFIGPLVRIRSIKISYLEYLRVDVDSIISRYETRITHQAIEQDNNGVHSETSWYKTLKELGLDIPEELLTIHKCLEKSQRSIHVDNSYYPIISYTKMPSEINHDHPIWKLTRQQTQIISTYLNTKNDIIHTINQLYSPPIVDWIKSSDIDLKKRWIRASRGLIDELAEHYIATDQLHTELDKWLTPIGPFYWRI